MNNFLNVDKESVTRALNDVVMICQSNLSRQVPASAVNPGATGADNVLAVYSIPANTLGLTRAQAKKLLISAYGSFGATGNNKQIKLIIGATAAVVGSTVSGGTTIADTGTVATNGGGWKLGADVSIYGTNGATQRSVLRLGQVGSALVTQPAPVALTLTQSGAILVAVTGNATTVVGDIGLHLFEVDSIQ